MPVKNDAKRYQWVKISIPKENRTPASDAAFYSIEELVADTTTADHTNVPKFVKTDGSTGEIEDMLMYDDVALNPDDFVHVDDFNEKSITAQPDLKKRKTQLTKEMPKLKRLPVDTSQKAWTDFSLHDDLVERLKGNGFPFPTPIQANVLQHAVHYHRDVVGCAPTGSGKTLAFGIPILNHYYSNQFPAFISLILSPTRELAHQIRSALLTVEPSLRIAAVTGGLSALKQERLLSKDPHVIVATPGRLWDFLTKNPELGDSLRKIRFLVIDEADRMVQGDHFKELNYILSRISLQEMANQSGSRLKRQTLVFSATLLEDDQMKHAIDGKKIHNHKDLTASPLISLVKVVEFYDKEPLYVNLSSNSVLAAGVFESKIDCLKNDKDIVLYYLLLRYTGRTIVFVNSIDAIRRLVPIFAHLQVNVFGLHAELKQKQRLSRLEQFKSSTSGVLIATDVAARGLDIPLVEQIIHYQVPRSSDIYVHRSGRTARGDGAEGSSILLLSPEEMQLYKKICNSLQKEHGLPNFPLDRAVFSRLRERVGLARQIDGLLHKSSKADHEDRWMKKAAMEADIYLSSEDEDAEINMKSQRGVKNSSQVSTLKTRLSHLLAQPVIPKGISVRYLTGNVQKDLASAFLSNSNISDGAPQGQSRVMPTFPTTSSSSDLKRVYESQRDSSSKAKRKK